MRHLSLKQIATACAFALICAAPLNCARAEPFRVGFSLPLSGANAAYGLAAKNGIEMARADDPALLNKISIVYEDNEFDAKKTIASFEKLRSADKADLIFVWGSQPCLSAAPLAERYGTPLACLSGDPKPGLRYVFSFNGPAADYAVPLARRLLTAKNQRWGLVCSDLPFLQMTITELKTALGAESKPVIEESVLPDAQDFKNVILNLKQKKIATLVLFLLPPQIAPFLTQAKNLGLRVQLLGTDTFSSTEALAAAHGLMEGALYTDMAVGKDFQRAYLARFKTQDNLSFAANTYEFAAFAADLFGGEPHGLPAEEIIMRLSGAGKRHGRISGGFAYVNDPAQGQFFRFAVQLRRIKGLDWEDAGD